MTINSMLRMLEQAQAHSLATHKLFSSPLLNLPAAEMARNLAIPSSMVKLYELSRDTSNLIQLPIMNLVRMKDFSMPHMAFVKTLTSLSKAGYLYPSNKLLTNAFTTSMLIPKHYESIARMVRLLQEPASIYSAFKLHNLEHLWKPWRDTNWLWRLPKPATDQQLKLRLFLSEIEGIWEALVRRDLKGALHLIREQLNFGKKTIFEILSKFEFQVDASEAEDLDQEVLYGFTLAYLQYLELPMTQLKEAGRLKNWFFNTMSRAIYGRFRRGTTSSFPRGGYRQQALALVSDDWQAEDGVDETSEWLFRKSEARHDLESICRNPLSKLQRLNSPTASRQEMIIKGIAQGRYESPEEILNEHSYDDWRLARQKLQIAAESLFLETE